ncbi:PAS domain-containing protein, partial [Chitinimonas sp.]|uniref:PAS domain-containing protein n=1 Tax=Chitinimonas sp. TaxID=1934313 RepID=UPI0035B122E6
MKAFLNHISLTQKLLAMGVLALVLFALPASQNWQRARDELATAEHERTGLAPMSLATMLLDLIQQQRRDSTALLVSGKGREKVTAAQAKVQAQLDALRSDKLVAGSKQLSADVAEMSKAQADIASRLAASTTVDENFDAHIALVDHTLALQASIAGETGLDLDPEATSYYLFDAAYNQLPPLVEALARARGYGVGAITAGSGNAGATELAAKAAISTRFALSMFTQVQDRLKKAALAQLASDDKEMATELDGIKQQMAGQVAEASNLANKLKSANFGNVSAEQYAAAFNTIIGSAYQTSSKLNKLLDGELDQRVERIKGDLRRLQLWTAILVLVLLASITAISLSLSRPMAAAVAAASRIADGDLDDAHIRQNGRNETSRLLNSLDDMRLKLKATLERERAIATENSRIRTALDCASAAVMIGDPQRQIVYANQSVRRLLQETEAEIRKALPQFNARDIIGKHVDDFHGNASHVQRVIDGMQGVHKARLHLGERHFVLSMNRVVDEAGTFLGTAVEWTDETEALREIERERNRAAAQARILAALDNTSVNVMIADASRTIIYMNGAVERMLRHAEADLRKVLPQFSVDKIIGSNIDSFHKNPSHQASLLATFTSTYQSKIQVGARHFHLTANPIINSEGERLGSVVEWRDITREVAIESEVAELIRGANQGDFTTRLSLSDKDGFFKILAENLNSLMEVSERGLAEVVRMLGALAQGDLTQRIDGDYAGTFGQLKDDSNATAEKLAEI